MAARLTWENMSGIASSRNSSDQAFLRLMDLRLIESPGFQPLVRRANELGLLEAILADDAETVASRLCQLKGPLLRLVDSDWKCGPLCGCSNASGFPLESE